jgi:hypothetical protein
MARSRRNLQHVRLETRDFQKLFSLHIVPYFAKEQSSPVAANLRDIVHIALQITYIL